MKISNITIKNYRLLKDFSIDLEDELSLILGKNNTGKTSLLSILDKFLNYSERKKFSFDDLNIETRNQLVKLTNGEQPIPENYTPIGISMRIKIQYSETDDLANIAKIIMDLDPNNNIIVLGFDYAISRDELEKAKIAFQAHLVKHPGRNALEFLSENHEEYFGKVKQKSIAFDTKSKAIIESKYIDLAKSGINLRTILCFQYISAKRDVTNKDNDKTLSHQTSKIYKKSEESKEQIDAIEQFKGTIYDTDKSLTCIYENMFGQIIKKIKKFGGMTNDDTIIRIMSTLQHRELLDGNTTVMYSHSNIDLPEHYNGLGYMNLISMIFDLEVIINAFKRTLKELPASINLLVIEEPEAHTHPQMQYVFIKNIKQLIRDSVKRSDGITINLQYLITTHSSHIVSESSFDDIKYLKRSEANCVISKNIKDLMNEYTDGEKNPGFRFLKQYLTLNRSELFFADKAILIEGDTERILVPAMMKKLDVEYPPAAGIQPICSQNISIIEVGAYSQIFERFIEFIGIRTLVITDFDTYFVDNSSGEDETKHCCPDDSRATATSNSSLIYFHGKSRTDIPYFCSLSIDKKTVKKTTEWSADPQGKLLIAYQTSENGYHGRSFEDSFFELNKEFINDESHDFQSIRSKWRNKYKEGTATALELSEKGVISKPSLAIEILLNGNAETEGEHSKWKTPEYIREGLEWLRKN